jgi:TatD DNase family protein
VIDSHCHLADEAFADDLDDVVARAKGAGLERALVILEGGNASEAAQAERIAALWPVVRFSVGVHPHQAHQFADDPARAAAVVRDQLANTPSARAVGEIGLDYHYDFSPRDVQQAVFRAQVRLARDTDRPIVVHTREADDDTLAILREAGGGDVRGVFHCFTGGDELADAGLALGFYISFAGILTFPKAAALRDTARRVPIDRLLT